MRKQRESTMMLAIFMVLVATVLFLPELIGAGDLEPSDVPGPTMKTLDQIPPTWSQKLPASERFELVLDGEAVLDKETGLVWARDGSLFPRNIMPALKWLCNSFIIGNRGGWRLPTIEELSTLLDRSQPGSPKLPPAHLFINVPLDQPYWSSTLDNLNYTPPKAGTLNFNNGSIQIESWGCCGYYGWPVRGGHGHDTY